MTLPTSFGAMLESKYLKKEDIEDDDGQIMTIASFTKTNVAPEGQEPEYKWVAQFEESPKGMVLNATTTQALQEIFGSPREAVGQRVCVYVDANVSFQGRRVGGLRIRPAVKRKAHPKQPTMDDINNDLRDAEAPPF